MLILAFSKIKISKCYSILLRVSRSGDIRTQVHTTFRLHEISLRVYYNEKTNTNFFYVRAIAKIVRRIEKFCKPI